MKSVDDYQPSFLDNRDLIGLPAKEFTREKICTLLKLTHISQNNDNIETADLLLRIEVRLKMGRFGGSD